MKYKFCLALLLFSFFVPVLKAQTAAQAKKSLLRDLLDLPAPPPVAAESRTDLKKSAARKDEFYFKKNVPPDDAPLEDLFAYWTRQSSNSGFVGAPKPSPTVLRRMVEAAPGEPEKLPFISVYLDEKPEYVDLIRRVLSDNADKIGEYGKGTLESWLRYHSREGAAELLKAAQKVKDKKNGDVRNETELRALAAIEWEKAEPLLKQMASDRIQLRTATVAARILYERALKDNDQSEAEKRRDELKRIVENRQAPARARDSAMDALFLNEHFAGRDEWYLSLLADETLFNLREEYDWFTGLTTPVRVNPEKWIPLMIRLVGNSNPNVHHAAVRNLAVFADGETRSKDALRALLPWLTDPNWAKDSASADRKQFIKSLAAADLPESVPGLIYVLTNEDGENAQNAVEALSQYKDSRAIPALKIALEKEPNRYRRDIYIKALIACGGISDAEQLAALEAFAEIIQTAESAEKLRQAVYDPKIPLPIEISVAVYLSNSAEPSENFIHLLLERIEALEKTNPGLAKSLEKIALRWENRALEAATMRRIAAGKADLETILLVLARREKLRERAAGDLSALFNGNAAARGIGAVVSGDEATMLGVLSQPETEAKIALLATARLVRAPLPVAEVAAYLDDKNELLRLAAERYIESEDSRPAREILLARHPDQAFVTGARDSFQPEKQKVYFSLYLQQIFNSVGQTFGLRNYPNIEKQEDELKKELLENAHLKEVFALINDGEFNQIVIRVFKDRASLIVHENKARYRERDLTDAELQSLRAFLDSKAVEDSPPLLNACYDRHGGGCATREFLSLRRAGGRRVFARNSISDESSPFYGLEKMLTEFAAVEGKLRYKLSDKIVGLEVHAADAGLEMKTVWKRGADLRVMTLKPYGDGEENDSSADAIKSQISVGDNDDEDDNSEREETPAEIEKAAEDEFQAEQKEKYGRFVWRAVKNGALAEIVRQPAEVPWLPGFDSLPEKRGFDYDVPAWQARLPNGDEIRADREETGLWRLSLAKAPVKLRAGKYGTPVVTPDGKWAIAFKVKKDWSEPHVLVRINLQTGRELPVNIAAAPILYADYYIAAHKKMLIARSRENDSEPDEYYLLDPETGAAAPVKGEFRPLSHQIVRELQAVAGAPNQFWAAISEEKTHSTEFGWYDAAKFEFKSLLKIPNIAFDSSEVWVDEIEGRFYFVYSGQVLSLPLPKNGVVR